MSSPVALQIEIRQCPDAVILILEPSISYVSSYVVDLSYTTTRSRSANESSLQGAKTWLKENLSHIKNSRGRRDQVRCFQVLNDQRLSPLARDHLLKSLEEVLRPLGISLVTKETHLPPVGFCLKFDGETEALLLKPLLPLHPPTQKGAKRRVLIVDDSRLIQKLLSQLLEHHPKLEVCGLASDPLEAEALIPTCKPDVVILDFHLPHKLGITYLKELIPQHQIPVLMISGAAGEDGTLALQALENGAFDFIQKPQGEDLAEFREQVCEKLLAARLTRGAPPRAARPIVASDRLALDKFVLIGSSTGGTVALSEILPRLPTDFPPIVIVQHIPEKFSAYFADRLNKICSMHVKEATQGDVLEPGKIFIAPGGRHLRLQKAGSKVLLDITDEDPVNRHRPSVDYMFQSAQFLASDVVAILLTGMGKDGARGLLRLKELGAWTMAQDAESCVVYGMPKAAAELGAADEIVNLERIPEALTQVLRNGWNRRKLKSSG